MFERRSAARSTAGAIARNGARGNTRTPAVLRASAVPARCEHTRIHSALIPAEFRPIKFSVGSKHSAISNSKARTNDLDWPETDAG